MEQNLKARYENIQSRIFKVYDTSEFENLALEVFRLQAATIPIYKNFLKGLYIVPESVKKVDEIPFLPVSFFKSQKVLAPRFEARRVFESSGTSGQIPGKHYVVNDDLYLESARRGFELFNGDLKDTCFLCLLPSYIERGNSSLVYMCKHFIARSGYRESGFYLDEMNLLNETIASLESRKIRTVLIGVSFALLDFAQSYSIPFRSTSIIETGGMKGRRRELTRFELHERLKSAFDLKSIGSEYGMTELLSQAYASEFGLFSTPPWMRVLIREVRDPLSWARPGKAGGISVIDLANLYSCSFLATQDLGRMLPDGRFEVLGRFDHSEVRGCSLLVV